MAKLSITTAWNETAAFVKQEAGPLFLIAFALMVLPSVILQVLMPGIMTPNMQPGGMVAAPQLAPGKLGLFFVGILVVVVLSFWGNLTITLLALRRRNVVGEAFRAAAGRILPLIGATFLLGIVAALLCLPLIFLTMATAGHQPGGLFFLLLCFYVLAFIFLAVRLMLMTATTAAEPIGPIAIIQRSWQLTAGHFWKLLGFFVLLMIVFLVIMIVASAIFGILIALVFSVPAPGSLGGMLVLLVTGIVQGLFVMVFATLLARIYEQLAGGSASAAQVFE